MKYFWCLLFVFHEVHAQAPAPYILFEDGNMMYADVQLDSARPLGGWKLRLGDGITVPILNVHSFQNSAGMYFRIVDRSVVTQKERDGRISLYRAIETDLFPEPSVLPNPFGRLKYFSKDNGAVIPVSYDNIFEAVEDNEHSRSLLDAYRWLDYAKYSAAAVTIGCIAYDLPRYSGYQKSPTASIVSGAVTAGIGFFSYFLQSILLERAVNEYNR